jgi:hypothetical protein
MSNLKDVLVTALLASLLSVVGLAFYMKPTLDRLRDDLALRPPVMVVDMANLAIESVPVGASKDEIDAHFVNAQKAVDRFSEAGYLVILRQSIVSAPAGLTLTPADIQAMSPEDDLIIEDKP